MVLLVDKILIITMCQITLPSRRQRNKKFPDYKSSKSFQKCPWGVSVNKVQAEVA